LLSLEGNTLITATEFIDFAETTIIDARMDETVFLSDLVVRNVSSLKEIINFGNSYDWTEKTIVI